MIGTIFNTCMILGGSILGSLFKKGMKEKYHEILMQALGLAVVALGLNTVVQHMPHSRYPVLFILSLAVGSVIGAFLDLDSRFDSLVSKHSNGQMAQGISTGILLFCIGTLSILGPVDRPRLRLRLRHRRLRPSSLLLAGINLSLRHTLCRIHQSVAADRTFNRRRHPDSCLGNQHPWNQEDQHHEHAAGPSHTTSRAAVHVICFT